MKISLSNLNNIQKLVISIFLSLVVISLFLHNPLSGYITEYKNPLYDLGLQKLPCSKQEKNQIRQDFEKLKEMGVQITNSKEETEAYIEKSVSECTKNAPRMLQLSALHQETKYPIMPWFGYVFNLVRLLSVSFIVSLIFVAVFKNNNAAN